MTSKKHWTNPDEFIPDRFLNNGKFYIPCNAFSPFGLGTRRCVGEKYAVATLFILFTRLIQATNDKCINHKILNQDYLRPDKNTFTELCAAKYEICFE